MSASTPYNLETKGLDPAVLAQQALQEGAFLDSLIEGISPASKKAALRENCSKTLIYLSEHHPRDLYSRWDAFVPLLECENNFSKMVAVYALANLAAVDDKNQFDRVFDLFFAQMEGESLMIAGHTAGVAGRIAMARPDLRSRIVQRLLAVNPSHFDAGRQDLVRSYAVQALAEIFDLLGPEERAAVSRFAGDLRASSSPRTRKAGEAFFKKILG